MEVRNMNIKIEDMILRDLIESSASQISEEDITDIEKENEIAWEETLARLLMD